MAKLFKKLTCVAFLLFAVIGCNGGNPATEYGRGYNKGVSDAREVQKSAGGLVAAGAGTMMKILPGDSDKSADWNAGYRAGYNDEANK